MSINIERANPLIEQQINEGEACHFRVDRSRWGPIKDPEALIKEYVAARIFEIFKRTCTMCWNLDIALVHFLQRPNFNAADESDKAFFNLTYRRY